MRPPRTQLVILSAAAQRDDRNVLPLPGSLRGGAVTKVIGALLSRGLVAESVTDGQPRADAAPDRVWRNDEDGRAVLLHITDAGLVAIGVEREPTPNGGHSAPEGATVAPSPDTAVVTPTSGAPAPGARKTREGTKQAYHAARTRGRHYRRDRCRDRVAAAHRRGALAGAHKKKLGLEVTSEKVEGRGRVYRLPVA